MVLWKERLSLVKCRVPGAFEQAPERDGNHKSPFARNNSMSA
jgi:hypothetical protein